MPRIPISTYRVQFHQEFPLERAIEILDYIRELGIGDLYASPLLAAHSGSQHGYDVIDPTRVNPEVGGNGALEQLSAGLNERGMGLLLDIVPNHMSASLENNWWQNVLQHGAGSDYARHFDIDWESPVPGLAGKVLLPVLGGPFRDVLEAGELALDHAGDEYVIRYFENQVPVAPDSLHLIADRDTPDRALSAMNGTPGEPASFDVLEALIRAQHYRLAFWRVGSAAINYRRFFDISDLVSLRAEDPAVFQATHDFLLQLAREGVVTGFRIDHIDGLQDPAGYLSRLADATPEQDGGFYVVVEKILASDEDLPDDWQTAGTSGYDFLNVLNGVFVDRRTVRDLDRTYARLRGSESDFEELVHERKHQVMAELFSGDIGSLARQLWSLASFLRAGIDLTLDEVEAAIVEMISQFQVYRTYTRSEHVSEEDRKRIEFAVAAAAGRVPDLERALEVLRQVVLLEFPEDLPADERQRWLQFVMRWQQFTGPIMAKGFEDTSLYVYNRLISLNEVGGEPDPAGVPLADLHEWAADRQRRWPGALSATSTHDTKRSEDVRARINVLSEMAAEWDEALSRWQILNREKKGEADGLLVPDGNVEHLIYHSMLGVWPFQQDEVPEFRERLKQYLLKASREAKTQTSWLDQNIEYEEALTGFVDRVIVDDASDPFMQEFLEFQATIAFHGALNSLSQTLLKTCMPGVPDFYQGTELWDLSMVDPDNRRPVDYELRKRMLTELQEASDPDLVERLLDEWPTGAVKLYLTWHALKTRRSHAHLFRDGQYVPLQASGSEGRHVAAFARVHTDRWVVVAAPRLMVSLARMRGRSTGEVPLGLEYWHGMTLTLPDGAPSRWRNVLTGDVIEAHDGAEGRSLELAALFARYPGALLIPE